MGREGEGMVADQGEEVMAVDQMDRTGRMVLVEAEEAFRAIRGVEEQKEVMEANLEEGMAAGQMEEDMAASQMLEVTAVDLVEEGTTVNLEGMAADQRGVMAADLEVNQGRMGMVAAEEDFKAIKVEVEEEREDFRQEEDIKTEVEESNDRILERGVLVQHQQGLLVEPPCPQDMTGKVRVIGMFLELLVDTILGDLLHLLRGIMTEELHPQ